MITCDVRGRIWWGSRDTEDTRWLHAACCISHSLRGDQRSLHSACLDRSVGLARATTIWPGAGVEGGGGGDSDPREKKGAAQGGLWVIPSSPPPPPPPPPLPPGPWLIALEHWGGGFSVPLHRLTGRAGPGRAGPGLPLAPGGAIAQVEDRTALGLGWPGWPWVCSGEGIDGL